MIRSAIARTTPAKEPKPPSGPRMRKCRNCRQPFELRSPMASVCGPECAEVVGKAVTIAKARKAERARKADERRSDRERKEALMGRPGWLAAVQEVFNQYIRLRDKDQPCICCGKYFDDKENFPGGQWDAGHWLSRGAAPHMRFVEANVHKQLKGHNRPGGTTRAAFRAGMIERIGLEAVEALECDQASRDYTIDDLKALKAHYKAKLKALTKEAACQN
jgi:hypothetical protein